MLAFLWRQSKAHRACVQRWADWWQPVSHPPWRRYVSPSCRFLQLTPVYPDKTEERVPSLWISAGSHLYVQTEY